MKQEGVINVYKSRPQDPPLKAYFDFSMLCNLSCRHCITNSSPHVDTSMEMTTDRILEVIIQLEKIGIKQIAIGGGEPFAHKDIKTILEKINQLQIPFVLTTNGTLLRNETIDFLKKIKPYEIRISLDGAEKTHNIIRGEGEYKKAISALKKLTVNGFNVIARLTVSSGAEFEIPELFADLAKNEIKTIKVAVTKSAGRAVSDGASFVWTNSTRDLAELLVAEAEKNGLLAQLSTDDFDFSDIETNDGQLRVEGRNNCGAGFDTCYISPFGDVYPCVTMPKVIFGNLKELNFSDIWSSRTAQIYRMTATQQSDRRLCDTACSNCLTNK